MKGCRGVDGEEMGAGKGRASRAWYNGPPGMGATLSQVPRFHILVSESLPSPFPSTPHAPEASVQC